MKDNHIDAKVDGLIRASMELANEPRAELNNKLKAAVYQQEKTMRKLPVTRSLSLWYLPMVANLVIFITLAVVAAIMISNTYLSWLAVGTCVYIGLVGVVLTIVGVKRTNFKEDITIRIQKRGAMA